MLRRPRIRIPSAQFERDPVWGRRPTVKRGVMRLDNTVPPGWVHCGPAICGFEGQATATPIAVSTVDKMKAIRVSSAEEQALIGIARAVSQVDCLSKITWIEVEERDENKSSLQARRARRENAHAHQPILNCYAQLQTGVCKILRMISADNILQGRKFHSLQTTRWLMLRHGPRARTT